MESLVGQIFVAMSAVIAALIAGAFAFFSLVVTKETKVSEFRQAWIDALRSEISTYISRLHAVSNLGQYIHEKPVEDKYNPDLLRERSRMYEEALSAYNSILLRINPNETNEEASRLNTEFLRTVRTAQRFYEAGHVEALDENLEALGSAAAPLLKYEWDRVRRGEPAYVRAKSTALAIAIGGGVSALILLLVAIVFVPDQNGQKAQSPVGTASASAPTPAAQIPKERPAPTATAAFAAPGSVSPVASAASK